MANHRRNLLPGGSYFFTVNLADRRRALLTDHIDLLRAAFRQARARHPFTIDALWCCRMAMPISPRAGA
jgi:REP-associated tyrosine transposase